MCLFISLLCGVGYYISHNLQETRIGCHINNVCLNHIFYADDTVLVASSPSALQSLIIDYSTSATDNEITFNGKKTKIMCVKPECRGDL